MALELNNLFYKEYKKQPDYFFDCGGRIEILGNHTDHNHGLCLAGTVNLTISAVVSKRDDLLIQIDSLGFNKFTLELGNFDYDSSENKSASMIRGVGKFLFDHGYKVGGFSATISSNIFPGAGVSSSAAFELLIGQIYNVLFNEGKIDRLTLAKAGQYSENNYFGKASGLLDQIGVAFGNIVGIDFEDIKNPKISNIEFPFDDLSFVIVNTGGDHSSMNRLYSKIPEDMRSAARKLGVDFLRQSSYEKLLSLNNLTQVEKERSIHFYKENERVKIAITALKNKDKNLFLKQVNLSRESSTNYLKNMMVDGHYHGSPLEACDFAMSILGEQGACKINGGGFAGSVVCVVPKEKVKIFMEKMSEKYGEDNVVNIEIRKKGPEAIFYEY